MGGIRYTIIKGDNFRDKLWELLTLIHTLTIPVLEMLPQYFYPLIVSGEIYFRVPRVFLIYLVDGNSFYSLNNPGVYLLY